MFSLLHSSGALLPFPFKPVASVLPLNNPVSVLLIVGPFLYKMISESHPKTYRLLSLP